MAVTFFFFLSVMVVKTSVRFRRLSLNYTSNLIQTQIYITNLTRVRTTIMLLNGDYRFHKHDPQSQKFFLGLNRLNLKKIVSGIQSGIYLLGNSSSAPAEPQIPSELT